ncbi:ABC transporter permease [Tessaracoccus antarcticus]|uniref:ABC transporter permease n=1 Tax=Tessaracoccus antarcticus TaxID=2479848 RepID=UPI0018F4DCF7|nr:ABC transporter permease [Tessaracoccus antarcticus]
MHRSPISTLWLHGLVRQRPGRLLGVTVGIALAVALLASLGSFLVMSKATMTDRATSSVAVDWQVQAAPEASSAAVEKAVGAQPGTVKALPVSFATVDGFSANTGGSQQKTGAGQVIGLPTDYRSTFPASLRTLVGSDAGVLLSQQTAANLRAAVGDTVTILIAGTPVNVTVNGVVDLPQADSFFQKVGAPPQSQPVAPPDNVILLPASVFDKIIGPAVASGNNPVIHQVHAIRSHELPPDPSVAYAQEAGAARNMEVTLAGAGQVGDNLGATLDAARQDSLYAQILFLFLGLPGAVLASLLTVSVARAGATRRRQDQALLRTRGATRKQVLWLAFAEAGTAAGVGATLGLGIAWLLSTTPLGGNTSSPSMTFGWVLGAAALAVLLAGLSIVLPARRDLTDQAITASRMSVRRQDRAPLWARWGLDFLVLAVSGAVFWVTSRSGYTLVLVPEGVPTLSVSYWAFAGPALLWLGCALLTWRLTDLLLRRGTRILTTLARPLAGTLAGPVVATLRRQRRLVAGTVVMLTLAVAFAASTASFNATYRHQAEVDAVLTNGADVAVTESPGAAVGPDQAQKIAEVPGVRAVEPLQHRYAYVGADLQDLYGVRPGTVAKATALQDAYFRGGTTNQLMATLAARPDSILVSEETVKDFQLQPGDQLSLRLQDGRTKAYTNVLFHYAGIVREFPTAPRDSFLVANADYVAQQTGSDAVGAFLVNTGGTNTGAVAAGVSGVVGPTAKVSEIGTSRAAIGSSLTSVDLAGLTRIELGFAGLLAAAASGLLLALGFAERRRTFAIAVALGARPGQLAGFLVAEATVVLVAGITFGAAIGSLLTGMLVKVLTGVFDPPPAAVSVPWGYLAAVAAVVLGLVLVVVAGMMRRLRTVDVTALREL